MPLTSHDEVIYVTGREYASPRLLGDKIVLLFLMAYLLFTGQAEFYLGA